MTETIEIASVSGQRVAKFSVQGLKISAFSWSQDSKSIVFAAVSPKQAAGESEPSTLEWRSVYAGDITGKIQKIGDLPALTGYSGLTFPATGGVAYCLVYWNGGSALCYVAPSKPVSVVEPEVTEPKFFWTGLPGSNTGKALVLTLDHLRPSNSPSSEQLGVKRSVVEVFEAKATILATGSDSLMLGRSQGSRFAYTIDDPQKKSPVLRVMEVK